MDDIIEAIFEFVVEVFGEFFVRLWRRSRVARCILYLLLLALPATPGVIAILQVLGNNFAWYTALLAALSAALLALWCYGLRRLGILRKPIDEKQSGSDLTSGGEALPSAELENAVFEDCAIPTDIFEEK